MNDIGYIIISHSFLILVLVYIKSKFIHDGCIYFINNSFKGKYKNNFNLIKIKINLL